MLYAEGTGFVIEPSWRSSDILHQLRKIVKQRRPWRGGVFCLISLFCLITILCGCASRQLTVKFAIVNEVNENSPVAVDLVRVADKDLAKEISKLTAADWFQKREQYRRDNSKPGVLVIDSREWVPGQTVAPFKVPAPLPLPLPIPLLGAPPMMLIFTNYLTPGPHRAKLQPNKMTTIELGQDDLTVVVDKK